FAQRENVARRELRGLAIDGARLRHIGMAQITDHGILIDSRLPSGHRAKRLELRGEQDAPRRGSIIERLDAQTVARQHQASRLAVPQREGKHADRPLDCGLHTPQRAGFEQNFGIGVAAHRTPGGLQLATDIAVIVDFAVEGDDVAPIGGMHRLRAARTEIDDGKPALPKHHAALGLDPDVAGIWTTMPHGLDHGFADRAQRIGRRSRAPIDHAGDAAHSLTPLAPYVPARSTSLLPTPAHLSRSIGASTDPGAADLAYHTPERPPVLI